MRPSHTDIRATNTPRYRDSMKIEIVRQRDIEFETQDTQGHRDR